MITAHYKCRNCGYFQARNINVDDDNPHALLNFMRGDTTVPCDCVAARPLFPNDAVYPKAGNKLLGIAVLVAVEH